MIRLKLTQMVVEKYPAPKSGRLEIRDTVQAGLILMITSGGGRSYLTRPRVKGLKNPLRYTLGEAGQDGMSLADARLATADVLRKCKRGEDPRTKPEPVAAVAPIPAAPAMTWEALAAKFIEEYAKPNTKTWKQAEGTFKLRVTPFWAGRDITTLEPEDVDEVLEAARKTSVYAANRTFAAVRKLCNWAFKKRLLKVNPCTGMDAYKGEVVRRRYLSFEEIRLVWRGAARIGQPFGPLFQMLLVCGQRRGETAAARLAGLDTEEELVWTLAKEETKAGRKHVVPLSDLALSIVAAQPRVEDPIQAEILRAKGSNQFAATFLFTTTGSTPVSGHTKAKADLDAAIMDIMREDAVAAGLNTNDVKPLEEWRVHDLRRTVATHLEEACGIAPHIVGAVLNHAPKGVTEEHYTQGLLLFERRRALTTWARLLTLIIEGGETLERVKAILSPKYMDDAVALDELRFMAFRPKAEWDNYVKTKLATQPVQEGQPQTETAQVAA